MLGDAIDIEALDRSLGERLLAAGKIDRAGLARAERLRESGSGRLSNLLSSLGLVSEPELALALATELQAKLLKPDDIPTEKVAEDKLSGRFLKQFSVLPLSLRGNELELAVADPFDLYAQDAVRLATGCDVKIAIGEKSLINRSVEDLYFNEEKDEDFGVLVSSAREVEEDVRRLKDLASETPVIRLVNEMIARAVETRASDIHIEPYQGALRVRNRIDGVLIETPAPPAELCAAVISRVKIMAALDIAERRLPQDGRIQTVVRGRKIDLRISTMPTLDGESVVIRILDRETVKLDFTSLGISERNVDRLEVMLANPNGIMLVTGPTGSGKTTTLYAALRGLNSPDKNVMTVEDPVEYRLDGVNQVQVKASIELSFARVLRSILRHDPDIIMVGEIRDRETAEIAVQAALTGHLVLSTLHTNDAVSSITRLLDMGVEDFLLTSSLCGMVAQRLVRMLCVECKTPTELPSEIVSKYQLDRFANAAGLRTHRAVGCSSCSHTGYRGRTSVMETALMTAALRSAILRRADSAELHEVAYAEGMESMFTDGLRKVAAGITTLEEVLRATRDVGMQ
ncbi:GspE/PulE family protein [Rhodoligotrophos defluvii]|uniref:GspE/PulE family protein n=1 Tax=Rhodoligotrophos defluvii TaxID=2561934 RepID=UPI0010C9ADA2|nr:GspE/PulE family protein [Rhodoligotrophos defluvii]